MEKKSIHDPEIFQQTRHRNHNYKKVATFLITLSRSEAVTLLSGMTPEETKGILTDVMEMGPLPEEEREKIWEEFGFKPDTPSSLDSGGKELAQSLALEVLGDADFLEVTP